MTHSVLLRQAEVLIVEDDKSQSALELEILSSAEYQVSAVERFQGAVELLNKKQFDVVILDYNST